MKRSTEDRILTTHAGSLPRPDALDDAVEQSEDANTYADVLRDSVADVVRKQVDVGVDVVNDGEFGKSSWTGYLSERLGGFEARAPEPGASPLAGRDRSTFDKFYSDAARDGTLWYRR